MKADWRHSAQVELLTNVKEINELNVAAGLPTFKAEVRYMTPQMNRLNHPSLNVKEKELRKLQNLKKKQKR